MHRQLAAPLSMAACVGMLVFSGHDALADGCPTPLTASIRNSCEVTKGVLLRGAKPDPEGAAALLSLNVGTVVNLELLHDDLEAFREARPSPPYSRKVEYFRIREWEPNVVIAPKVLDAHVADFLAIVETQPRPVYVHCRSGENRTGVMVAAYRVLVEGMPIDQAIDEMQKYQGFWLKQDAEYIRSLAGDHAREILALAQARSGDLRPDAYLLCTVSGCEASK